ncbi:TolB family protein [Carboxylicivirga taeanensis]|uniref:TolB family protein n=1 Tax=Carboxylicivirga taeanensis TaxID=1416875 RepID=UPI003F6DEF9D
MKHPMLLISLLVFCTCEMLAQPALKRGPVKLIEAHEKHYMNAEWSPDGTKVAFTSEKHVGIYVCDPNGKNLKQLSEDDNAGFSFSWSSDGRSILSRPTVITDGNRYKEIVMYDVVDGVKEVLVEKSQSIISLPVWAEGGSAVAYSTLNGLEKVETGKVALKGQETQPVSLLKSSVVAAPKDIVLHQPEFENRYVFNVVQSPNRAKVVFQVNGLGLYVINADGTELKHLGYGEQASWTPDSRYVLVTLVKDDGVTLTEGSISAIDVETGVTYPLLNDQQIIALNPAVSPDGTKVLIDNAKDGSIYQFELK